MTSATPAAVDSTSGSLDERDALEPALRPQPFFIRWMKRALARAIWLVRGLFGLLALSVALATVAAIPVAQFLVLGYLLAMAGRVAKSGQIRAAFVDVDRAAKLGGMALAVWLLLLPARLLWDWRLDVLLVDGNSTKWIVFALIETFLVGVILFQFVVVVLRGDGFGYFFRPISNARWLWRLRKDASAQRPRHDTGGLRKLATGTLHYFMTGSLGFLAGWLWLALPSALLAIGHDRPVAGWLGGIALVFLLGYVPFAQVRFVVEGRLQAALEVKALRERFRRAPIAFALSLALTVLLATPLYLLRIERLPPDVLWLPDLLFLWTMAPAKISWGWAYWRGREDLAPRSVLIVWPCRLVMFMASAFYVLIVFFTQYTGWDGAWAILHQHAFLLPVPF